MTLEPGNYLVTMLPHSGYPASGSTIVNFNIIFAEVITANFGTTREVYAPVLWQ